MKKKQPNYKLLNVLAKFLDALLRKRFDIGVVCQINECGTTACAMGWTPTIPTFKKLGVKYRSFNRTKVAEYLDITYKQALGYRAVAMKLFGIENIDVSFLFTDSGYRVVKPTPKSVAKQIRKFIENRKAGKVLTEENGRFIWCKAN